MKLPRLVEPLTGEQFLALVAIIALTSLGHVLAEVSMPPTNSTIVGMIVGAMATAVTIAGGKKIADTVKSGDTTINTGDQPPSPPTP